MQNLFELIEKHSDLSKPVSVGNNKNVIVFSHLANTKELAKVFVDYAAIPKSYEEALARQKTVVEDEFFKTQGSLQWNFYYYYLLADNDYKKAIADENFRKIERDTNYARKRIVNYDLLKKQYPFESILSEVAANSGGFRDLSNEWTAILKEKQLDEVYNFDSQFGAAVERYVEGRPDTKDVVTVDVESLDAFCPHSIERVNLESFRSHKKGISYNFKQVNLIEGVNGVGKTSLLESIELLLCGRTLRNEHLGVEADIDISLKYNAKEELEKYEPRNAKKYKNRERFWYGVPPGAQVALHRHFNRFNFFNTDASYRLATDTESAGIWSSFRALALGSETTELAKRIDGFTERFSAEKRRLAKNILALSGDIKKDKAAIDLFSKDDGGTPLNVDVIGSLLKELGRTYEVDEFSKEILDVVQKDLQRVFIVLETIGESLSIADSDSFSKGMLREEINSVQLLSKIKQEFEASKKIKEREKDNIEKAGKAKKLIKDKCDRLIVYSETQNATRIRALDAEYADVVKLHSKCNLIASKVKPIDLVDSPYDADSLNERLTKLADARDANKKILNEVDADIKAARDGVEALKGLIVEIKGLGRRYLDLTDESKCPLCDSKFEREELERRIEAISVQAGNLAELLQKRADTDLILKNTQVELESLSRLENAFLEIQKETGLQIIEVKNLVQREIDRLSTYKSLIDEKKNILDSLNMHGFTIKEFEDLSEVLELTYLDDNKLKNDLSEMNSRLESELKDLRAKYEVARDDVKNAENDFLSEMGKYQKVGKIDDALAWIAEKEQGYRKYSASAKEVLEDHALSDELDLRGTYFAIGLVLKDIQQYLTSLSAKEKSAENIKKLQETLKEREASFKEEEERMGRVAMALQAFTRITSEYDSDKAVKTFFDQNKKIIIDIFKVIHSPNEFDSIDIDEENSKIFVKKGNIARELSQISTGQRAALALSIFLGMHLSCPLAPRILIFDDPIAFIDDLNVLAFLDFLREIAIKGERQIFIASANKKLCSLIQRKFDLLGGDIFKVIHPEKV